MVNPYMPQFIESLFFNRLEMYLDNRCKNCDGTGQEIAPYGISIYRECLKCNGIGRVEGQLWMK